MTRILKNKYLYLLFIIPFILLILNKNIKTDLSEIKKCNQLDFEQASLLHPNNFAPLQIYISFTNDKKWHSNQFKNRKTYLKNNYYLNKNRNKAEIIVSIPKKMKCSLSVSIKPHGDLEDHHIPFNLLPSLQVKIKDGHIFGITNFLLLKPKTRLNIDSEIFATAIIKELDLLAPRTTRAIIYYNDTRQNYIFQEKIVKEFLEINNFKEGEIISFDDRFNYTKDFDLISNSQYKLVNNKWARKNNILSFRNNIEVLNAVRHNHKYIDGGPDDLYSTAKKFNVAFMFEQLPKFSAIMTAINADHGLSIDDRRFYFDSLSNRYIPIYYDGMSYLFFKDNINKPALYSSVLGAKAALNKLEKINKNDFIIKLQRLGIKKEYDELDKNINKVKRNLIELEKLNINDKPKITTPVEIDTKYDNPIIYAFKGNNLFTYELCDKSFEECYITNFEKEIQYKLVSQELKIKNKEVIFIATNKKEFLNNLWSRNINKKIINYENHEFINKNNKFLLIGIGDVDIYFDKQLNELQIIKNATKARVIILNGKINNLKIDFLDNTELNSNTDNYLNITGCLTFYNLEISKLKVNIKKSKCEDALNIIKSKGSISNINIEQSISDGLDLDFSEIEIANLKIQNSLDDCLDVSFGKYQINSLIADGCLDKGISSEFSLSIITKAIIKNTDMAIVSKDYSLVKITEANVSHSNYCANAYNKKQEFSGGEIGITHLLCNNGLIKKDIMSKINIEN